MEQKLITVFSKFFHITEQSVSNASMQTIAAWDSLKHIELVMTLEEQFSLGKITPDEIVEMTSFNKIREVLAKKVC